GGPSVLGAVAAAALFARHVPPPAAQAVIGVVLVVSGLSLLTPVRASAGGRPSVALEVAIGFALGALTAATGLMLGSLRLPVMMRLLDLDPKVAAGTNMTIGCATVLTGVAVSLLTADVRWPALGVVLLAVVPPTVAGGWLGGRLTARLSEGAVRRLAGGLIAASGVPLVAGAVLGPAA
ncbi:MAG: TSUP family transporter, partial [Gemmataceae bacterium]